MIFLDVLIGYILPVIYNSFVVLVLVLLFLFIFRIRDSNIRILFFFLPLIKPFIVIMERVDAEWAYSMNRGLAFGIRFPDPADIIAYADAPLSFISNPDYFIMTIVVSLIGIVLIIRWIVLALFYRRLAFEDKVNRPDIPDVFEIINGYVEKAKIKIPDVSLTHRHYLSPFVIGIKKAVLVLSPALIDVLSPGEKEILIKHELSHIRRNDNLIGWLAIILRDINFFNPFAYIAYFLIRSEQETAADKLIIKYTDHSPKDIARNILGSILKLINLTHPGRRSAPAGSYQFSLINALSQKRLANRVHAIIKTDPKKLFMRVFPKILIYFLFILLLFIQIIHFMEIDGYLIFLR